MKGYSYKTMNLIMIGNENFSTDCEEALLWRIT